MSPFNFCWLFLVLLTFVLYGVLAQMARALRSQCRSQGFDSPILHSEESKV